MTAAGLDKAGGVRLRVDLDAFAANVEAVRERVAPAELMLVVKDDAYGHGLACIVERAVMEGVRWFGAFDVRAGMVARRAAGEDARIFAWLTVGAHEIRSALASSIDLGVGEAEFLADIAEVARETGITARVHLKIDTGLHRNGIRPEDWADVLRAARGFEDAGLIRIVGVWSHIAEASDDEDDAARAAFDDAVAAAEGEGFTLEVRHLAASAASFARPEYRYDLVRVGAFCYGIRSAGGPGEDELGVRPIASLVAPVTSVDGEGASVAVGALDGLPSTLAGRVSFGGHVVRRIGETASQLVRWPGVTVGDEITVFGGAGSSATDLAEAIDTVGEEILVRISPLVRREYH